MADAKDTAPAAPKDVPSPRKIEALIKGAQLTRIPRDGKRFPAAVYKGDAPKKGSKLRLQLSDGAVYAGIVHDVTDADGEVLVEFRDGLAVE